MPKIATTAASLSTPPRGAGSRRAVAFDASSDEEPSSPTSPIAAQQLVPSPSKGRHTSKAQLAANNDTEEKRKKRKSIIEEKKRRRSTMVFQGGSPR